MGRFLSLWACITGGILLSPVLALIPAERAIASSYIDAHLVSSKTTKISGASIHYLASGPSITSSTSKMLIFCHGASFTSSTWQIVGVLDELGSQGYPTIALDLPGYGDSDSLKTARLSTADHKEVDRESFLAAFLLSLGVSISTKVVVVSASMGGTFALPFVSNPSPYNVAGYITVAGTLSRITMSNDAPPALIIFGENDSRMNTDQSRYKDLFPRSDIVIFKNAPHPAYMRDRAAANLFTDLVLQFVRGGSSGLPKAEVQFHVGASVESQYYKGQVRDKYFPATVTKVHGDFTYDLTFNNYQETKVSPSYMRATAYSQSKAVSNNQEVMPTLIYKANW